MLHSHARQTLSTAARIVDATQKLGLAAQSRHLGVVSPSLTDAQLSEERNFTGTTHAWAWIEPPEPARSHCLMALALCGCSRQTLCWDR
eukprot:COSAG02_NODE_1295_length_13400_cov_5.691828_21_plen_89_part_00